MKIVCSTETLAFGVNSSMDVVIIADLKKQDGGDVRFLSMNEFRNYSGRAGRLKQGMDPKDAKGYVYTLLLEKTGRRGTKFAGQRLPRISSTADFITTTASSSPSFC